MTAFQFDKQFAGRGTNKLIVSHMRDRIEQNQSDDFVESDRLSLDWQHTLAFSEHTVTAGVFAMTENAKSLSFGSGFDEDTDVAAIFLQDQWIRDRHRAHDPSRTLEPRETRARFDLSFRVTRTPRWPP